MYLSEFALADRADELDLCPRDGGQKCRVEAAIEIRRNGNERLGGKGGPEKMASDKLDSIH